MNIEKEKDPLVKENRDVTKQEARLQRAFARARLDNIQNKRLVAAINECLRVTADGSMPDEWDGSYGGSGHAKIRSILEDILSKTGIFCEACDGDGYVEGIDSYGEAWGATCPVCKGAKFV